MKLQSKAIVHSRISNASGERRKIERMGTIKNMSLKFVVLLVPLVGASGCTTSTPSRADVVSSSRETPASVVADGTYRIRICEGDCGAGSKILKGVLVIDSSGKAFLQQSDAMQALMKNDSGQGAKNYCYYFDPKTSNSKDTLFEYDVVAFGKMQKSPKNQTIFSFQLGSPDFRYYSIVSAADSKSFTGDWSSSAAVHGGKNDGYADVRLRAERISAVNANFCFDAARQYRRNDLKEYCRAFPTKTCEPGDRQ